MTSDRRVLLLRTFNDRDLDFRDIALLALAVQRHAKLVMVGEEQENQKLRTALLTFLPTSAIDGSVDLVDSRDEDWERVVIDQILRADSLLIRFTPKSLEFPDMVVPEKPIDSFLEFYQISPIQPRSGRGLLFELSLCHRLDALSRTVLLVNETQANEVIHTVQLAYAAQGGDLLSGAGRSLVPRFTGLDKQLGHLRNVAYALALPPRDALALDDQISLAMQEAIRKATLGVMSSTSVGHAIADRVAENYLDFGVSDEPKKVFPDYKEKIIRYTPVETLVFLSPGNLIEISYKDVVTNFGLVEEQTECPYCQARAPSLFLYQHGHVVERTGAIRCKCQQCGRRSTLIDGMLVDM